MVNADQRVLFRAQEKGFAKPYMKTFIEKCVIKMEKKKVNIRSINFIQNLMTIKHHLGKLDGVKSVRGDNNKKTITIEWGSPSTWALIVETLEDSGYISES